MAYINIDIYIWVTRYSSYKSSLILNCLVYSFFPFLDEDAGQNDVRSTMPKCGLLYNTAA